jgi:hypothetical protein
MAKLDDTDELVCSLLSGLSYGLGGLLAVLCVVGTAFDILNSFQPGGNQDPYSWWGLWFLLFLAAPLLGIGWFFSWLAARSKTDR